MLRVHGTAIACDGLAVLLVGPPGAGKSDLALRLIDRGALLVADDQVEIMQAGSGLTVRSPASIAGRIEIRGVGIVTMPFAPVAELALLVDLAAAPERLPGPAFRTFLGVSVPLLALAPFQPSAPLKVERAVALARSLALWSADADR